jgi:hypothetical protein
MEGAESLSSKCRIMIKEMIDNKLEVHIKYWWGRLTEIHKPRSEGSNKMELRKVDWINLVQCRDIWRAVLNTEIPFILYNAWEI